MRNWPYAYSIGPGPEVVEDRRQVQRHGAAARPGGHSVGTVGGWQLGVNKYSKHIDASIEFVRYMTSAAAQKFDAITNTNVPTIPAVAKDPAVVKVEPVPQARDRDRRARRASVDRTGSASTTRARRPSTRGSARSSTAGPQAACCRPSSPSSSGSFPLSEPNRSRGRTASAILPRLTPDVDRRDPSTSPPPPAQVDEAPAAADAARLAAAPAVTRGRRVRRDLPARQDHLPELHRPAVPRARARATGSGSRTTATSGTTRSSATPSGRRSSSR